MLYKAYQNEKIEELRNLTNLEGVSKAHLRSIKKFVGKDNIPKVQSEIVVKRRERKWIIGEQISTDGNIMTSPGLSKLIELKHAVDKLPTNFNFEKKILRSSVPKRII